METATPVQCSRFQFTLTDLLLIVFLTALGMLGLLRLLRNEIEPLGVLIFVLVASGAGTAWAIYRANSYHLHGFLRGVCLTILLSLSWAGCALPSCLILAPFFVVRMPGNQTAAAGACKAFAEAEEIFRRTDWDGDGVLEYSPCISGLLGVPSDPVLLDKCLVAAEGPPSAKPPPKAGYCFKVLTAQSANATGGQRSYIDENGNMTKGYALIAYPAVYDGTGRDCFIISHNGTIFQKDFGTDTHAIVEAMTEFNPDTVWCPAE